MVWIEKSTPYGDIKRITLPDKTTVWLNAGSTIIYPEEFQPNTQNLSWQEVKKVIEKEGVE